MNLTVGSTASDQYNPQNFTENTNLLSNIYVSANVITIILGLPANCYIVWLMLTGKGTGFVSDVFGLNLACGEIFYCLSNLVFFCGYSSPAKSNLMCFMTVIPIYGRPLFLSLICVERYVAVVYPVTFLKYKPLRYRLASSAAVWMMVAGFGTFCMFQMCSIEVYLFLCVILPQYSLFLIVKLFCCLAVVRALKMPRPGESGRQREEASLLKRRAITIILILTVAMIINYTPFFFVGIVYAFVALEDFMLLWMISVFISMIVAFVQPFLYIQRFGNFTLISRVFSIFMHKSSTTSTSG